MVGINSPGPFLDRARAAERFPALLARRRRLGVLVVLAFVRFQRTAASLFGAEAAAMCAVISALQASELPATALIAPFLSYVPCE